MSERFQCALYALYNTKSYYIPRILLDMIKAFLYKVS